MISTTRKLFWQDLAICRERRNLLLLVFHFWCFALEQVVYPLRIVWLKRNKRLPLHMVSFQVDHAFGQQIHPQSAMVFAVATLLPFQHNHPVLRRTLLLAFFGPGVFVFGGLWGMGLGLLCMHQLDSLLVGS